MVCTSRRQKGQVEYGKPLEGTIVIGGMLPPNAEVLMLKIIQTLCKDPDISNEYALFGCLNRIEVRQRSDVESGFLRSADGDENSARTCRGRGAVEASVLQDVWRRSVTCCDTIARVRASLLLRSK